MKTEVLCSYTLSLMEVEQVVGKKTQNDHLLLSCVKTKIAKRNVSGNTVPDLNSSKYLPPHQLNVLVQTL